MRIERCRQVGLVFGSLPLDTFGRDVHVICRDQKPHLEPIFIWHQPLQMAFPATRCIHNPPAAKGRGFGRWEEGF